MKKNIKQKEAMLTQEFNARTAPPIPDNWQNSLMNAVRNENTHGFQTVNASNNIEEKYILRFAIGSAIAAAASLILFVSIYFYTGQSETQKQDNTIFETGLENIIDTI